MRDSLRESMTRRRGKRQNKGGDGSHLEPVREVNYNECLWTK